MTFVFCNKRKGNPRLEISVCLNMKCPHAHATAELLECQFIPEAQKKAARKAAKKARELKKMRSVDPGDFIEVDIK